jgi:TRAP transporter TAXI family solute receptor
MPLGELPGEQDPVLVSARLSTIAKLCLDVGDRMKSVLLAAMAALVVLPGLALAQGAAPTQNPPRAARPAPAPAAPSADRLNAGVVSVVSGGVNGTYVRIAAEMANVLDDGESLRVLPVIGRGSAQNIRDLLYLRGIDIGIVQMDAREALGPEATEGKRQLEYIARLYNEEIHVIARRDIADIRSLAGRKVNIDVAGSGTNLTSRIIFERLGIKPDFVSVDQGAAFERLASGEIDAAVFVSAAGPGGAPTSRRAGASACCRSPSRRPSPSSTCRPASPTPTIRP